LGHIKHTSDFKRKDNISGLTGSSIRRGLHRNDEENGNKKKTLPRSGDSSQEANGTTTTNTHLPRGNT